MPVSRLCRACGDWHPMDQPWPAGCAKHFKRTDAVSSLPRPMIISDAQSGIKSMADGKVYESKSEMRKGYKAAGFRELGSDAPTTPSAPSRPKITKAEIGAALQRVKQGYRPNLPAD